MLTPISLAFSKSSQIGPSSSNHLKRGQFQRIQHRVRQGLGSLNDFRVSEVQAVASLFCQRIHNSLEWSRCLAYHDRYTIAMCRTHLNYMGRSPHTCTKFGVHAVRRCLAVSSEVQTYSRFLNSFHSETEAGNCVNPWRRSQPAANV